MCLITEEEIHKETTKHRPPSNAATMPVSKKKNLEFRKRRRMLKEAGKKTGTTTTRTNTPGGEENGTPSRETAEKQNDPADPVAANSSTNALLASSGYGGLGMGGMMGGMGMMGMGGMGMYGSPYGMGMGPLNTLNQFLFGVQTAIYSLSSAVQVIGMNTQALHQLADAASKMVDHALATWHELRALEASASEQETEEQKMRRRKLKALRWAMVVAGTYAVYRLLRSLMSARKNRRRLTASSDPSYASNNYAMTPYNSGGYSGYGMSPYGSTGGMYGGSMYGGGYAPSYGGYHY